MLMIVGELPPPVHGASMVTERISELVSRSERPWLAISTAVSLDRWYHVRRLIRHLSAALAVLRHRPDTLYQSGVGGPALYYQAGLAWIASILGCANVFHHHSYAYLEQRRWAMRILCRAVGKSAVHIVLCPDMATKLETLYATKNTRVISNAALMTPHDARMSGDSGSIHIGHLSNLSVAKGLAVVLDAVVEARRLGLDARLTLAGPTTDGESLALIERHMAEHADTDRWLGPLEPSKVHEYMRGLDCFLFPSCYSNEASPLVVFEALRAGTPVISTAVGCLASLLESQGWTAGSEAKEVALTVQRVVRDPVSRVHARNLFDMEHAKGIAGMDGVLT